MKIKLIGFLSASALALAAATPAMAGQINFSSQGLTDNSVVGNGVSYTFPGTDLTAYALVPGGPVGFTPSYNCSGTGTSTYPCLYFKNGGSAAETGLGLQGDPAGNNEIFNPNGVGFVTSSGYISGFELGSVQNGESWQILGCDNQNGCANVLDAGIGNGGSNTVTITGLGAYEAYVVTVPCADGVDTCNPWALGGAGGSGTTDIPNNILVMSVTTVPEPGTLALLAAGLAGLGFAVSRRRKVNTHA